MEKTKPFTQEQQWMLERLHFLSTKLSNTGKGGGLTHEHYTERERLSGQVKDFLLC